MTHQSPYERPPTNWLPGAEFMLMSFGLGMCAGALLTLLLLGRVL